eukprot:g2032.t1
MGTRGQRTTEGGVHHRTHDELQGERGRRSVGREHTKRTSMEMEEYWSPDGDEADERDAVAPLLPHPAGATGGVAVGGATAAAQRDTSSANPERGWRREVVARLVSSSGPVAAQHARRGARRGRSGSGIPRLDVLPEASAAAAAAEARGQRRSIRRSRNEHGGHPEEGKGEEEPSSATHGSPGLSFDLSFGDGVSGAAASVMEADGSGVESSSQGSSESEEDSSANPMVVTNPPEEVRRALASSHNTIALLLLLLLHFLVTHIMGLACVVLGSATIVGLDRRLRSHADAQVLKSRFVLFGVAVTAVLFVALSATVLNNFPEGDHLLRGLLLMEPKPDVSTVYAVIRTTPLSASGGDGNDAGEVGRDGNLADGTGILLSRAGRQRRVYAIVEMAFMLYRCLLPIPVWLQFYGKESDYFAALYLVLKGMEVSFRTDRLVRAVCYVRRGELDRGKFATPEEVSEVGSPDCSICYDQMVRPLILPCKHLFCGSCVAEWLERERTCPLCRDEVPSSNPIPKALRDGRTAIVPQVL